MWTKKIKFSHNPFSMPQGDINDIDISKPLKMKAYQYDIVCNGIESVSYTHLTLPTKCWV